MSRRRFQMPDTFEGLSALARKWREEREPATEAVRSARAAVDAARFEALRYQAAGHVHLAGYWREQVARRMTALEALS